MSEIQKINDHSHLFSYVKKFTSAHWGKTFVSDLISSGKSIAIVHNNSTLKLEHLYDSRDLRETVTFCQYNMVCITFLLVDFINKCAKHLEMPKEHQKFE